jgi:hypothetical protein
MIDHKELPVVGAEPTTGLLDLIRSRALVLPEFQRSFLWSKKPDKTTSLLTSIAQGWPAGALLLMAGDRGFQWNPVEGWKADAGYPVAKQIQYALLDGQQRMTALYQAFYNRSPAYVFAIAIMDLLNAGEIDPEDEGTFRSFGRKTWEKQYGTIEKQREAELISVGDLVNAKAWEFWKDGFDANTKAELNELRENGPLAGLLRYRFPVSIVLDSAPDEALANIFVTINQQGIKLTTFDLVVARTVKRAGKGGQAGFNLRDVWEKAAGREETEDEPGIPPKHERIRNFQIDPEVPLKLVRLVVDPATKLSDTTILRLKPSDVQQRVERAVKTIDDVLGFLEEQIGLIPATLADPNYLLPVALAAHTKPAILKTKGDSARVLRWYWAATFRMIFGRGRTGDLIPQSARALVDWVIHHGPEPDVTTGFWSAFDQDLRFRLFQGTAQNGHFLRALFALEIAEGALDWRGMPDGDGGFEEFELRDAGTWPPTRLDVHHMWARGVKKPPKAKQNLNGIEIPSGEDAYESVVNRCLLLKETNIAVGNTPFASVDKLENVRREWIETYLLDPDTDKWEDFVAARLEKVHEALEKRVPKPA